jgi:hypothetical protein
MPKKNLTLSDFIDKSNRIHNNKYNYGQTVFTSTRDKLKIACPLHGEFEQRASAHLSGQGCKFCKNESVRNRFKFTKDEFLKNLNEWQKENLDFSNFSYVTDKIKGNVRCKIHNSQFSITPNNLKKSKRGCPECGRVLHAELVKNTKDEFIELSIKKHGDIFDYTLIPESFHSHDYIQIKCKECCSIFERVAYSHCNIGHSCPKCSASKTHKILENFLDQLNVKYKRNDRTILNGQEIDILVPEQNIGIECNGNYWHSEELLSSINYHLNKTTECEKRNIQLLHFFEDELIFKMDIIKSIIQQKLKKCNNKIYARNCQIRDVDISEKNEFLNNNHIQGEDQSKIKLGLYYDNELVSLMTFGVPRYNKHVQYELIRFCNKKFTNVVGGASRLLSYFIKHHSPQSIISYADKRISNGNLYTALKFKYSHDSEPRYFYFPKKNPLKRMHRSNFTKAKIKQKYPEVDLSKTEKDIMKELQFGRIWDCGTKVYVWKSI